MKSIMWLCDFCINPHYFIDYFISVKSTLHSGDKAYLVMVSIHFYIWLDLVCQYFVERICIYKKYLRNNKYFLGCFWLSYQRIMAPRSKLESVFPVGLERGGIKEELLNYWCYCPWIFFLVEFISEVMYVSLSFSLWEVICVYEYVCVCVHVHKHISVGAYMFECCMYLHSYLCVCLSINVDMCKCHCVCFYIHECAYVWVCACMGMYMCVYILCGGMFACDCIHLFMCVWVCAYVLVIQPPLVINYSVLLFSSFGSSLYLFRSSVSCWLFNMFTYSCSPCVYLLFWFLWRQDCNTFLNTVRPLQDIAQQFLLKPTKTIVLQWRASRVFDVCGLYPSSLFSSISVLFQKQTHSSPTAGVWWE